MTTTTTTADLLDRNEIETLVHRLGACLDEGRFDDLRTLFTTDAVASTPGGVAQGIDALIAQASRNHVPDDGIQHLISGVLVERDGDTASVRANLLVTFARRAPAPTGPESAPAAPAALGEVYRFAARRTPAGWRLTRVATTPVWVSHTPVEPFGPAGA
ncbi:MAG TPA: nuclear transport factor 2 family protein [Acidimicrobiales bacterium]|nr:nuclear transport factor 2 family protein [Acidimicrobiales bacterium]